MISILYAIAWVLLVMLRGLVDSVALAVGLKRNVPIGDPIWRWRAR